MSLHEFLNMIGFSRHTANYEVSGLVRKDKVARIEPCSTPAAAKPHPRLACSHAHRYAA